MIIVITSLTYARLEVYRSSNLKQAEFNRYMDQKERSYINQTAIWWYENSRAETRKPQSGPSAKSGARSRLSFLVFIDKNKQAQHAKEYPKMYLLAKKLIYSLYRQQPFFLEFEQTRPDIVDALLNSLMIADILPKEQKIKKAAELANLNLGDPVLNTFFYFVLKGSPIAPEANKKKEEEPPPPLGGFIHQEQEGEVEDEDGDPNPEETFKSPQGYYSLLDFITLDDATKVRVYLAPRLLLNAIFDDPAVVDSIIVLRNELYKKVASDSLSAQEASQEFKALVAPKSDPNFDETLLDFSVTKTNPKNYE